MVLDALKRHEEALESLDRAVGAAVPATPSYTTTEVTTLKGLGHYEEALASYDRALAIAPDLAESPTTIAAVRSPELDRREEALANFDRGLSLILEAGRHQDPGRYRACAAIECSESDRSKNSIKHLSANANSTDALNNRGQRSKSAQTLR